MTKKKKKKKGKRRRISFELNLEILFLWHVWMGVDPKFIK